jgi:predicted nucleic acid-binding protein
LRKGRRANPNLVRWFADVSDDDLFLSVLTIAEIRKGVDSIQRRDPSSAAALNRWIRRTVDGFADRILAVTHDVAEEWGRMNVPDPLPVIDGLIAATAKVHGLSVATRNTRHVARTGVAWINPFSAG